MNGKIAAVLLAATMLTTPGIRSHGSPTLTIRPQRRR